MSTVWDPALYLDFDDHRSRPFHDLLARVGATSPRRVVDLGCGPGNLTAVLAARWPDATVVASDSSAEMVAAARERGIAAAQADVVDWTPAPDDDVVITNAVLQWVPTHLDLLPRWLSAMPPAAWFALQVPGNFGAPSHVLVRELLEEPAWRGKVGVRGGDAVPDPEVYAELMAAAGADVDVWETTYLQCLTGTDPVLKWISATALRPVRDALPADDYAAFRSELAPRLREAYPARPDGTTWFPFRRIFAVARTPRRGRA
ncbi:trans-aconitate 2-methyltransferase [Pseudonocardia sp.]|jgi:trans-aconitate 2-methyltransferase|uniref:trans-aconitate 2-methyltransferase n=1 Tax=Pseudonocardia sp. TaxID=60912 RepID=UPI002630ED27|nr:trans-aconitate 2-methyltransferase [Pseudonocardia sp.]MCW2721495.1 Trans-aconitate 2-methyltransferase [Pseudonocardia sp.]MDT7612997.1 trans-aconitate 2-methyltransferase [Pseudonocardiales bacterium]